MTTREEISMIGFAIVAYAGDAKTALLKAIEEARNGNFDKARDYVKESNQSIVDAHKEQTQLLSQEAGGNDLDVTFIMVHAQDSLMTTMMLKDQAEYYIDLYERLKRLEDK